MRGKGRHDGTVMQAGVARAERDYHPMGWGNMLLRGVVLRTYLDGAPLAADGQHRPYDEARAMAQVECDVYLFRSPRRRVLKRVPVAQHGSGYANVHGLWIPRPSSRSLDPGGRQEIDGIEGAKTPVPPANPDALDGDHVLVQFIENDPTQPIISASYPHPKARWKASRSSGQHYPTEHQGTKAKIDERGNVTLDTTGATLPDGDTVSNDGKSGNVTATVKTAAQLLISKGATFFGMLADGTLIASAGSDGYIEFSRTRKTMTLVGPQGQYLTMSESGIFCIEQSGHFWKMQKGGPLQISSFTDLILSLQTLGAQVGDQPLPHEFMSATGGAAGGFIAPFLAFVNAVSAAAAIMAAPPLDPTGAKSAAFGTAVVTAVTALLAAAGTPPGTSWTVK